jgi:predicted outer membrane repeat protein
MKNRMVVSLLVGMLLASSGYAVVYVDKDSTAPAPDGTSWATAYQTLQAGIDAAAAVASPGNPEEVWVAEGNYDEQRTLLWGSPAEVEGSLVMKDNVHMYGGFRGVETLRSQRLYGQYRTFIDGTTARGGTNAFHVVAVGGDGIPTEDVVLDGFFIHGGLASGQAGDYHTWRGGGLYNWLSSPTIAHCVFFNNRAVTTGGAISSESTDPGTGLIVAEPIITDCLFRNNVCDSLDSVPSNPIRGGGAVFINGGTALTEGFCEAKIVNCTFYNNSANSTALTGGVSILNFNCGLDLPRIKNSIFWNVPASNDQIFTMRPIHVPGTFPRYPADVDYCDVQGGHSGAGNINADPLFRAPGNNPPDFRLWVSLTVNSPCLEAGSNAEVLSSQDIRAFGRINGIVDQGAYEMTAIPDADFEGAPLDINVGTTVNFTDRSNTYGLWQETAWAWNFGDVGSPNNTSTLQNPSHQYNASGRYTVTLTTTTVENGNTETKSNYVVVHTPPVADFSGNPLAGVGTPATPLVVTFTDLSVADLLPASSIYITDWWWDFDGDSVEDLHYTDTTIPPSVQRSYTTGDTGPYFYTVSLRVRTNLGAEHSTTKTDYIEVYPTPLSVSNVAILESSGAAPNDGNINMGHNVQFSVTAQNGYPPYTYQWQFQQGGAGPWAPLADGSYPRTVNGSDGPGLTPVTTVIAGALSPTLSITRALDGHDEGKYRCVVTDSGTPPPINQVISNEPALDVDGTKLFYVLQPQGARKYSLDAHLFSAKVIGGSGPAAGYIFNWAKDGVTPAPGSTNAATYSLPSLAPASSGTYFVLVFYNDGILFDSIYSDDAVLEVKAAVSIDTQPASQHANVGGNVTFSVVPAGGYTPYTSAWYWNSTTLLTDGPHPSGSGAVVSNAGTTSITISGLGLADAGDYHCVAIDNVNSGAKSRATSNAAALTVTVLLAVTDPIPATQSLYVGENAFFSATASGGDGNYTFQWQRDVGAGFVNVNNGDLGGRAVVSLVGANGATLALNAVELADGGLYRCVVSDTSPDPDAFPVNPAALGVYDNLAITAGTPADVTDNVGNTVSFTVETTGGVPTLSYVWECSADGTPGTWVVLADGPHPADALSTISGADSATLQILLGSTDAFGSFYHCIVTDSGGVAQTVTSRDARLTITNFLNVSGPNDVRAYTGETGVQVSVTVVAGQPPYSYDWKKGGVSLGGFVQDQNTWSLGAADAGDIGEYTVEVMDTSGGINPNVISAPAQVLVADPPVITQSPQGVKIYAGQDAQFSVAMTGGFLPYVYDWQQVGVGSLGAPSQNTLLLSSVPAGFSGNQYLAQVTDAGSTVPGSSYPTGYTRESDAATLIVAASALAFDTQPVSARAYTDDSPFYLSVAISGGLPPYTFEWRRAEGGSGEVLVGGNTSALLVDPAVEGPSLADYRVDVTDDIPVTYPSDTAEVDIKNHLSLDSDLEGEYEFVEGQDRSMGVVVNADSGLGQITYVWSKDVAKALEVIPGAEDPVLSFNPVTEADTGQYQVVISDEGSSFTVGDSIASTLATLIVSAGVPVAGGLGLAALAALVALGGAATIRRRK